MSSMQAELQLVHFYLERKKHLQARTNLKLLKMREPENPDVDLAIARLELAQGYDKEAELALGRVLHKQPARVEARDLMIPLLIKRMKAREAVALARELMRDYPHEPYYPAIIAHVLWIFLNAPENEVREYLRVAYANDPENELAMQTEFQIEFQKTNLPELKNIVARFLKAHPASEAAGLMLSEYLATLDPKDYETIRALAREFPQEKSFFDFLIQAKVDSHWLMWARRWIEWPLAKRVNPFLVWLTRRSLGTLLGLITLCSILVGVGMGAFMAGLNYLQKNGFPNIFLALLIPEVVFVVVVLGTFGARAALLAYYRRVGF